MAQDLTNTLCTRCGLCCDGTLFADVELAGRAEAEQMEVLGLEIEDDDTSAPLLVQPCAALRGRKCGIYEHRPGCCRTFECRLLQDAQRGAVSVDEALATITEALGLVRVAKSSLAALGRRDANLPLAERASEAISQGADAGREADEHPTVLAATMSRLSGLLRKSFLRGAE
jgi:Fe-S-cluster containining protein